MSASVLESADLVQAAIPAAEDKQVQTFREPSGWRPDIFAREQIRRLVRQLFFTSSANPVRHVVFWATDPGTDVQRICLQVAESLAVDSSGSVAMVSHALSHDRQDLTESLTTTEQSGAIAEENSTPLRQFSIRVQKNLWVVPQGRLFENGRVSTLSRLSELRRQFEYSIVQGPSAGQSGEAAALGQSADGIVLVLAAHVTRRATALKIKGTLESAQVRLLGTVLSDRRFPIPEAIYRLL